MAFNIQRFRAHGLQQMGARPTQFEVQVFPPFSTPSSARFQLLCRSASLPPFQISPILVPYFGRHIKVPGDRDFPDWTVTVMNDEDFAMRKIFERWSNIINTLISNRLDPSVDVAGLKQTALVTQFAKDGSTIEQYEFDGLWPSVVDPIPLDWDQQNAIEQFDVTFSYDWFQPAANIFQGPDAYVPVLPDDGQQT